MVGFGCINYAVKNHRIHVEYKYSPQIVSQQYVKKCFGAVMRREMMKRLIPFWRHSYVVLEGD